jgi:hypothetical protein
MRKRVENSFSEGAEDAPVSGKKLPARSTGTRNRETAMLVIADWLTNGIKTAKGTGKRPIETVCDIKSIVKAIRKTELTPNDALLIVKTLTDLSLVDLVAVHGETARLS